jgi:hypothetical protein
MAQSDRSSPNSHHDSRHKTCRTSGDMPGGQVQLTPAEGQIHSDELERGTAKLCQSNHATRLRGMDRQSGAEA